MDHLKNLSLIIPDIEKRKSLDLGSGRRGDFLITMLLVGMDAYGIEYKKERVELTKQRLSDAGLDSTRSIHGAGEKLPYKDKTFDFINMAETIEHVQSPDKVFKEMYRVMKPGACAYVSVPNRFSFKDPHYHLYFINWMPRAPGERLAGVLGKNKKNSESGMQTLSDMHYMTRGQFVNLGESNGFKVSDGTMMKINAKYGFPIKLPIIIGYKILSPLFASDFRYILSK